MNDLGAVRFPRSRTNVRIKRAADRKRYMEQQEQTPGAKRSYERRAKKEQGGG